MNKLRITATSALLLCNPAFAGPNLDAAAGDLCKCLVEPYKQMNQASKSFGQAQASGDLSQLTAVQSEMMAVLNASKPCFEALSRKYPAIDKSDSLKKRVMAIAEKQCPSPIPAMPK